MPDKRTKTHASGTFINSSSVFRNQPTNALTRPLQSATVSHKDSIIFISSDSEFGPADLDDASSDIEMLGINGGPSKVHSHASGGHVDWKQVEI